ncbi:MAG TPA: NrfD/PsrC family molybdoenzyme membrane anchor subunit [Azospirillum sp.]|nr:NrfD/PsrC family molybdoenzyme membrane anchor subunit [Azospirillum sp.]
MAALPHHEAGAIVLEQRFGWRWAAGFAAALGGVLVLAVACAGLFVWGVGVWGTNVPYVWAFDIINYVWWIGIANAASLLAAALVLRGARWRTSINRFAEAAALFAVLCAGLFPILHLGRPWLFHWVFPYPATFEVWPQFRSPLVWDFFAILTHIVVTALFWYVGLIPDLAALRDRARTRRGQVVFGALALGWRGSARHWLNHQKAYRILAALVVPLVVFMQSTVSFEFAVTVVPDWHRARFAPYFVVSGLLSGLAMVLVVALLVRTLLGLHELVTRRHIDIIAKLLLANAVVMAWSYGFEGFVAWQAGEHAWHSALEKVTGPFAPLTWGAMLGTVGAAQALWFARVRRSAPALIAVGVLVNAGVWLDRLVIVVGGLYRDHLPSSWGTYGPTWWEAGLLAGTIGLFCALMLLFVRFVPAISMFETHAEHGGPGVRPGVRP